MNNISKTIDNIENYTQIENTNTLFEILNKIKLAFDANNSNIKEIKKIKKQLKNINSKLETENISEKIFLEIDHINSQYNNFETQNKQNNNIIYDFLNYYTQNYPHVTQANLQSPFISAETPQTQEPLNPQKTSEPVENKKIDVLFAQKSTNKEEKINTNQNNNTSLLISEKDNLVYLPYTTNEIEEIFNKNPEKYENLQDVIDTNYTISLNRFKNPIIARFREAFSLMKNREHASLPKCLDLALELSVNSLLNPAIICACKNLEELDIYLDFLETNELEKFKIFEVKYEVSPL